MRTSQLVSALKNRYAESLFTKDLLAACKGTIEALAAQDFGANGFDYEQCPYDAYQDADFGAICGALDFTGYAELGPKACFADCFAQFAELIFTQLCDGITKSFVLKNDLYTVEGLIKAYDECRDLFGCGAIYQLIRACNNLEAWGYKAELLSVLGPKSFVAFKGLRSLIIEYACEAKHTAEKADLDRILNRK